MNRPWTPGTLWNQGEIRQVLAWSQQGGIYRWLRDEQPSILKVLHLPSLAPEELEARRQRLRTALAAWRSLDAPHLVPVLEVVEESDRVVLVLKDVPGQPLSQIAQHWQPTQPLAAFLGQLVVQAQQLDPLGLSLFQIDHWLVHDGSLRLFNPGWTNLLWSEDRPVEPQPLEQVRALGRWLAVLSPHLQPPPAWLDWMLQRCNHPDPSRCYADLDALRRALSEIQIQHPPRPQSGGEVSDLDLSSIPQPAPPRPLPLRLQFTLLLLCVLALTLASNLRERQQLSARWQGSGLYLLRDKELCKLSPEGRVLASTPLPAPPAQLVGGTDGRLYLTFQGEAWLGILEGGSLRRYPLRGLPARLHWQPAEATLLAQLPSGLVSPLNLRAGRPIQLEALALGDGRLLTALAGGWVVEGDQGLEFWRGLPPVCRATRPGQPPVQAVSQGELLLCLQSDPAKLCALDEELAVVAQRELKRQPLALLASPFERRCWTVEARNITRWKVPDLSEDASTSASSGVLCSCPDPQGGLWWLDDEGELWRWERSGSPRRMGHPGRAQRLIYVQG